MRPLITALLAALIAGAGLHGAALAQEDEGGRGNPHGCVNPAGHERGWCRDEDDQGDRDGGRRRGNYSTISGTIVAMNGTIATFRQDNGSTIVIDESSLARTGMRLYVGGHYTLQGYWSNNVFVVQNTGRYSGGGYYNGYPNNRYPNNGYPNNGYPNNGYPGSGSANASVQGIITAVSGDRVTIMQGLFSTVTINDSQALNAGAVPNLSIGRSITAYGYWNGGTFYAVGIR